PPARGRYRNAALVTEPSQARATVKYPAAGGQDRPYRALGEQAAVTAVTITTPFRHPRAAPGEAAALGGWARRRLPRPGPGGRVVPPEAELVSLRVLGRHEPAHARHRGRVVRLAPKVPDARGARVDVVHGEVGARAPLAGLHVGDRQAPLVADACHVVLEGTGIRLELPAEQPAPELAALAGVVGRDLEMHNLTGHGSSPLRRCGPADAVTRLQCGRMDAPHRRCDRPAPAQSTPPPLGHRAAGRR